MAVICIVWVDPAGSETESVSVPPGTVCAEGVLLHMAVPPAVGGRDRQDPASAEGAGTEKPPDDAPFALYVTVSVTNGVAGVRVELHRLCQRSTRRDTLAGDRAVHRQRHHRRRRHGRQEAAVRKTGGAAEKRRHERRPDRIRQRDRHRAAGSRRTASGPRARRRGWEARRRQDAGQDGSAADGAEDGRRAVPGDLRARAQARAEKDRGHDEQRADSQSPARARAAPGVRGVAAVTRIVDPYSRRRSPPGSAGDPPAPGAGPAAAAGLKHRSSGRAARLARAGLARREAGIWTATGRWKCGR